MTVPSEPVPVTPDSGTELLGKTAPALPVPVVLGSPACRTGVSVPAELVPETPVIGTVLTGVSAPIDPVAVTPVRASVTSGESGTKAAGGSGAVIRIASTPLELRNLSGSTAVVGGVEETANAVL